MLGMRGIGPKRCQMIALWIGARPRPLRLLGHALVPGSAKSVRLAFCQKQPRLSRSGFSTGLSICFLGRQTVLATDLDHSVGGYGGSWVTTARGKGHIEAGTSLPEPPLNSDTP